MFPGFTDVLFPAFAGCDCDVPEGIDEAPLAGAEFPDPPGGPPAKFCRHEDWVAKVDPPTEIGVGGAPGAPPCPPGLVICIRIFPVQFP